MNKTIINFMPGPVNLHPDVKDVFHSTFLSHRSAKFYTDVQNFKSELCEFVNAQNAAFFVGSGSLGNEVVAQYLKQLQGSGLILVNGEFGKRLTEQARHLELKFEIYSKELGETFDYNEIGKLAATGKYEWIWFVHCETSSGVLNELKTIKKIGADSKIKIAVDCISSIGNTSVDLSDVFIASGTSGKGLASYPGISMVYYSKEVLQLSTSAIPKYMNLKHHKENNEVPYTISTNLFYSLVHAFNGIKKDSHRENIKVISDFVYEELTKIGFSFLGNYNTIMPGIVSIVCPLELNSYDLGVKLEQNNFYVNYGGAYLRHANYFQICVMGHQELENAEKLVEFLRTKALRFNLQMAS